jgi:hypothetical protein
VQIFLELPGGSTFWLGLSCCWPSGHAAGVSAADDLTDFISASGTLRGAFTILHDIPFFLGGTSNTLTTKTIIEIKHWIKLTSSDSNTISETRPIFKDNIVTITEYTNQHVIIRLPLT